MNWWQKPHIFKGIPVSLPPVPYFVPFLPPTSSILSPHYIFQVLDPQQSPPALHSHQHRTDSSLWTFPLSSAVETILQCMNTSFIKDGLFRATKIICFLPFFSRSQLQHIHLLLRQKTKRKQAHDSAGRYPHKDRVFNHQDWKSHPQGNQMFGHPIC